MARLLLLVAVLGVVFAAHPMPGCDPTKGEESTPLGDCSKGTKVRFCVSKKEVAQTGGGAATFTNYELVRFLSDDCSNPDDLKMIAEACGYMSGDGGYNLQAACTTDQPKLAACNDALQACKNKTPASKCTDETFKKSSFQTISSKCTVDKKCGSEFGCCPDGVTGATGKFNTGCCKYRSPGTGGSCNLAIDSEGGSVCRSSKAQNSCHGTLGVQFDAATVFTDAGRTTQRKCYCDESCGLTKDCCDGLHSTDLCRVAILDPSSTVTAAASTR